MKCGRCKSDTHVGKHTVDGFSGRLCDECADVWDSFLESRYAG
jgi:transposase-like protein